VIIHDLAHSSACAVAGMATGLVKKQANEKNTTAKLKPVIVASMFGNTTTCVNHARSLLTNEHGYEVLVFHAVGTSYYCLIVGMMDVQLSCTRNWRTVNGSCT